MPKQDPDQTKTWHESLVNAGIRESDLSMICTYN